MEHEITFTNSFVQISYSQAESLVKAEWSPKSAYMTGEDFKTCISAIWATVREKKPRYFLGDTRYFLFPITPDLQEWYGANIKDTFSHTQKLAMLLSEEIISQFSIEQTIEEDRTTGAVTRYFSDLQKALAWLHKQTPS